MTFGLVLLALLGSGFASVVPAAVAAPLVAAPAAIGYAKAVPYNIPPYASRVDISTRNLAAPYLAAPVAPYVAAPAALPYAALPAALPAAHLAAAPFARTLAAPIPQAYVAPGLW